MLALIDVVTFCDKLWGGGNRTYVTSRLELELEGGTDSAESPAKFMSDIVSI